MYTDFTISVDEGLCKRFEMALQLSNENKDNVISFFIKSYIAKVFAQEAALYEETPPVQFEQDEEPIDKYFGKAIRRIPKWATKPVQYNHKIIRAYLLLSRRGVVTYNMLVDYCGDKSNPDVYVPTFSTNFASMRWDSEKSHGKVFEVDENGVVTIWDYVAGCLAEHKRDFLK